MIHIHEETQVYCIYFLDQVPLHSPLHEIHCHNILPKDSNKASNIITA